MEHIEITGELTIYRVDGMRKELFGKIGALDEIIIDLKNLEETDVAGIQLLISIRKLADQSGKTFGVLNPTDGFLEVLEAIGLEPAFFSLM